MIIQKHSHDEQMSFLEQYETEAKKHLEELFTVLKEKHGADVSIEFEFQIAARMKTTLWLNGEPLGVTANTLITPDKPKYRDLTRWAGRVAGGKLNLRSPELWMRARIAKHFLKGGSYSTLPDYDKDRMRELIWVRPSALDAIVDPGLARAVNKYMDKMEKEKKQQKVGRSLEFEPAKKGRKKKSKEQQSVSKRNIEFEGGET